MFETSFLNKRFYIKITSGKYQGDMKTVYYRNGLPFQIYNKWMWYYKYRAALEQVKNPRFHVELHYGSYDYVPTAEQEAVTFANLIKGKKATITKYERKLQMAEQTWCQLFPIEEDAMYLKCV